MDKQMEKASLCALGKIFGFEPKIATALITHAGSASSLIACQKAGLDAWGFEIEPFYFKKAKERLEAEKAQLTMFELAKRCD
jgi:DNA modification methylase